MTTFASSSIAAEWIMQHPWTAIFGIGAALAGWPLLALWLDRRRVARVYEATLRPECRPCTCTVEPTEEGRP